MFQFAYPWLLLLIILPFIIYYGLPSSSQQETTGASLPINQQLLDYQEKSAFKKPTWNKPLFLLWLLWILLIAALAGPQWLGNPIQTQQYGRNIMIALDLSGSMQTEDMQFHQQFDSRINVVKNVASQFIKQRPHDRIGLVLFGSQAYLQTPLTFDHNTLQSMLSDASVGLAGQQTAIGDAIGLTIKRLMHYPKNSRILILLTDGVNNAGNVLPLDAARIAAKQHIRIYTIGLTGQKLTIDTPLGKQVIDTRNDLDEPTLKNIADLTGGVFFKAESANDLKKVYKTLNDLETTVDNKQYNRPIKPLYFYPLGLAFIISCIIAMLVVFNGRKREFNT